MPTLLTDRSQQLRPPAVDIAVARIQPLAQASPISVDVDTG